MLKHAVTIVGTLTALALATTSEAASGLPIGKRQHTVSGSTRPGLGVLRSMDGGATWHRGTVPAGSVRFLVDSPRQADRTGRITGIAVDPSDPLAPRGPHFRARPTGTHLGTADGGAWKTRNGGASWLPMHRDIVITLRRGTAAKPGAHIPTYVHVITNSGGNAGALRRAPRLRSR